VPVCFSPFRSLSVSALGCFLTRKTSACSALALRPFETRVFCFVHSMFTDFYLFLRILLAMTVVFGDGSLQGLPISWIVFVAWPTPPTFFLFSHTFAPAMGRHLNFLQPDGRSGLQICTQLSFSPCSLVAERKVWAVFPPPLSPPSFFVVPRRHLRHFVFC